MKEKEVGLFILTNVIDLVIDALIGKWYLNAVNLKSAFTVQIRENCSISSCVLHAHSLYIISSLIRVIRYF